MTNLRWGVGDGRLFAAAIGLVLVSMMAIVSAVGQETPGLAVRHGLWALAGILAAGGLAQVNARRWMDLAWLVYGLGVLALLLVEVAGATRLGAQRWLSVGGFSLQPSELAKLGTLWLLAHWLGQAPPPLPARIVWGSLAIAAFPAGLVFLQPDLGSATIFGAIWLGMVWVAGASARWMAVFWGAAFACLPLGWQVLKAYQRERLMVFLNPHIDPLGAGYTIIQSMIAIGSGQWWGRGWFAGTQNRLSFLPEHHSDFIFAVVGEEGGLVGGCAVISLFLVLLWRLARLAHQAIQPQARLFAVGVFCWIGYQAVVNMGMVMGLLPVVGVPLPLVSYGGTSMLMLWVTLGLVQSAHRTEAAE